MRSLPMMRCLRIVQALALLAMGTTLFAAEPFSDPVDDLREALKLPDRDQKKKLKAAELDVRKKNVQKRVDALRSIGELSEALELKWYVDDLDEGVADLDAQLRRQVLERFLKGVRGVLEKGNADSQQAAAELLGAMGLRVRFDQKGVAGELSPELIKITQDKERASRVRAAAARALGKIGGDPAKTAPALGLLLRSPEPRERQAAADALDSMIADASETYRGVSRNPEAKLSPAELISVAAQVARAAARGARDPDRLVRLQVLDTLRNAAFILNDRAVGIIGEPLSRLDFPPGSTADNSEEVADYAQFVADERKAVLPLTQAFREHAADLRDALRDRDNEVRLKASLALAEIGYARYRLALRAASIPPFDRKIPADADHLLAVFQNTREALTECLSDPDVRVRRAALTIVEMLGSDAALVLDELLKSLEDADRFVRWTAVRTLGRLAPAHAERVVPALAGHLREQDLGLRVTTARMLAGYGPAAEPALPELIRAASRGDVDIRLAAIHAIQNIGPAAKPAIPALTNAVRSGEPEVRAAAARALGRFGPDARSAIPTLRSALQSDETDVRKAASEALLSIIP